jgi:hypothetical protein
LEFIIIAEEAENRNNPGIQIDRIYPQKKPIEDNGDIGT